MEREMVVVDEIYEVSNRRLLHVPWIPANARYPVEIGSTNLNLSGADIKRGTVEIAFTFPFELEEIQSIKVWVTNENGNTALDVMKWKDETGVNREPHVLSNPFRSGLWGMRLPVHCISRKGNRFSITVEFKDRLGVTVQEQTVHIDFEAHFESEGEYINIADHARLTPNDFVARSDFEYEELKLTIYTWEDELSGPFYASAIRDEFVYDELKLTIYTWEDFLTPTAGGGFVYSKMEYDDLYSITIGGRS